MNRRSFLVGLGLIAAPAIIRPGILMPIRVQSDLDRWSFWGTNTTWLNTMPVWTGVHIESGEDICAEIRGDRWERQNGVWKAMPGACAQSS
jgi:hypothetical protein